MILPLPGMVSETYSSSSSSAAKTEAALPLLLELLPLLPEVVVVLAAVDSSVSPLALELELALDVPDAPLSELTGLPLLPPREPTLPSP
jgi:hypothetical protein